MLPSVSRRVPFWASGEGLLGRQAERRPRVKGWIGVWGRDGVRQLIMNSHPLYNYAGARRGHVATGEGVKGFGGIWHVVKAFAHAGSAPRPER